jgi:CRP/FNR family transcriptional regulator, cyclic AMP receptor protein
MTAASATYSGGIGDKLLLAMFGGETADVRLELGEVLFANGDASNDMYVVLEGTLTIRNGPVVYEDVGPGGIVGEMGLVEAHLPRSAMVYAKTPAGLVTIDEQRFLSLVAANPDFALSVMRILSRRLRRMDERYETTRSDGI